jgi:hypothetical protein
MSPPTREGRPGGDTETAQDPTTRSTGILSQQVSFWSVHTFVAGALGQVADWPMVGTPAWCDLGPHEPAKWAAILDAAQHWALRVETCQEAHAEASRAISDGEDWTTISREINRRNDFYAARPWLRRVPA